MKNTDAIVFDAYGTLFDIQSLDDRLAHYFGDRAPAISRTWRQKQLEYTWLRALMKCYVPFSQVTREALVYAGQAQEVDLTDTMQDDLLERYVSLSAYADVPSTLETLSRDHRLAILSNADPTLLEPAVRHNKLGSYLEAVLSADVRQTYKTDPQVYQLAVDALALPAECITFVTSNPWDAAGAKAFGFVTVWIDKGAVPEQLGLSADRVVHEFRDLLTLLAGPS